MSREISGIIAPMVTPFTRCGDIDMECLRREILVLLNTGIDGISPGGSTGEGAMLTDEELCLIIEEIKKVNERQIPIVAGVIRNSTRDALKTGLAAKNAGADALMVTPTSYNALVADDDGNFDFYNKIARDIGLPVIIYNVVPQNNITPKLFARLTQIENVVGIKQSNGGIAGFYAMKMANKTNGKVFSATDDMLYSTFELSADGAISAIISAFPELCVEMWSCVKQGNPARALQIQNSLYEVWQTIAGNQFPIRLKTALKLLGRNPGYTRSPIVHISEDEEKKISEAIDSFRRNKI